MDDETGYLRRLGLTTRPPATLAGLREVHRAHVARIPYDNLSAMLGRPDPADPVACVARAAAGERVGYCFQQNAALGWLLTELGFSVSRRHGHAWTDPARRLDTDLNHLVLVVSRLPTDDNPGGHWWADAGLGEGFAEPLPLVRGDHDVDGWSFGIGASYGTRSADRPTGPAAWTFRHLPGGLPTGIVVTSRDHDQAVIDGAHDALSRGAESPFRRVLVGFRIDGPRLFRVRGCAHQVRTPASCDQRDLTSYDEWRGALADDLLLPSDDVTDEEWCTLWDRTLASHRAWDEAGRP